MRTGMYRLKHRKTIPIDESFWLKGMPGGDPIKHNRIRRDGKWPKGKDCVLSTVFLCIDHGIDDEPELFETMLFKEREGVLLERYATHREAINGHRKHKQAIRELIKKGEI